MSRIKRGPDFLDARQLQQEQARRAAEFEDPTRVLSFWPGVPPCARISGNDTSSWWRQAIAVEHYAGPRLVVAAGGIEDHR